MATLTDHIFYLLGLRKKYYISGHSMYPLLRDGAVVLLKKESQYHTGDVVVAEHPFRKLRIVKIISHVRSNARLERSAFNHRKRTPCGSCVTPNEYDLRGLDAIESEDSKSFGAVAKDAIVGRVTAVVSGQ